MMTRVQLVILRRWLRHQEHKRKRDEESQARRWQLHLHVWCWRCRRPLYHCACPLESMEDWYDCTTR